MLGFHLIPQSFYLVAINRHVYNKVGDLASDAAKLSDNDQNILVGLDGWLSKAKFEKINADNFELCVDGGLFGKWTLLKDMDLVTKV